MNTEIQVIPKEQRKNVLFLTDDLRHTTGLANQARIITKQLCGLYNWYCVGGSASVKPEERGKALNASKSLQDETKVEDAELFIYPTENYGNQRLVRNIIDKHNIDLIFHFTDPRYWQWLYEMEYELRMKQIPLVYYALWDAPPAPLYNGSSYVSCDTIISISKQSHAIHNKVIKNFENPVKKNPLLYYIPHAVDTEIFKPLDSEDPKYKSFLATYNIPEDGLMVFWNNKNIKRKQPIDVLYGFGQFWDNFVKNNNGEKPKAFLYMHTNPYFSHGPNLVKCHKDLCPDADVRFSTNFLTEEQLNYLYNRADVTVNLACNEGFGISGIESIAAGTPIINNVTGGLQDHLGLTKNDGSYLTAEDYQDFYPDVSVTDNKRFFEYAWGTWAFPVFHSTPVRNFIGTQETPYIFEEYPNIEKYTSILEQVYNIKYGKLHGTKPNHLKEIGLKGREFLAEAGFTVDKLSENLHKAFQKTLETYPTYKKETLITL